MELSETSPDKLPMPTQPQEEVLNQERANVKRIIHNIRKRLNANNDMVACISGPEGSGKSTLAIKLGFAIDKNFSIKKNVIVNPDVIKIQEKILRELEPGSALVIDEGIRTMYKRNFFSEENKFLNELFAICRKKRIFTAICIPNFWDLDQFYKNHRVKAWFYVPIRGKAVVFVPDYDAFAEDKWELRENRKIVVQKRGRRKIAEFGIGDLLNIYRDYNNHYVGDFSFTKLAPHIEEEYLKEVEEFRKELDFNKDKKEKKDRYKRRFVDMRFRYASLAKYLREQDILAYTEIDRAIGNAENYTQKLLGYMKEKDLWEDKPEESKDLKDFG